MDKKISIEKILEIFKTIALPCGSEKEMGEKEKKIIELLKEKYPSISFNPKTGIIIPAKKEPKMVISSHYDLIPVFQKGFQKNREPFLRREDGVIKGALDNTLTNAVLIYLLLKFDLPDNVEIIFTNMEEIGCIGMRNYLKEIEQKQPKIDKEKDIFFVNLDVTNECWKEKVSLEMDRPIYEIIHFLKNEIKGMTEEREGDDLCEVINFGYKGFSFCLPTKKTIHSWKNRTTIQHIEEYAEKLLLIIENSQKILILAQNKVFSYISIEKILNSTKEEIENMNSYCHTYCNDSFYGYGFEDEYDDFNPNLEDFVINVIDTLHNEFPDYVDAYEFEVIEQNIVNAIYDSYFVQESFTFEEVTFDLETKKELRLAKKMLECLCKENLLIKEKVKYDNRNVTIFYTPKFDF